MTYRRILVPIDGSPRGRAATAHAIDFAKTTGGQLTGLFVLDTAAFMGAPAGLEWQALSDAIREEGKRALQDFEHAAKAANVPVATKIAEGHPAQEIIREAKEHDLIVMGTLGRTGLAHLLLGSVAERVIRHAPCPVLVHRV